MDTDNNLPLPLEKFPKCWHDEERMSALFSPFRSKTANPQDWTSKYKFWQNLINEWLIHTTQCSFSIADLNCAFKRKGCTPLCLVTVIEELLRNKEIILETEFLKEPCDSWTAWSIDMFLKRPLTWSFSKIFKTYVISNEVNNEPRYIHLESIKKLGNTVFSVLEDKKESVLVPFSEIVKSCKSKVGKNIRENTMMLTLIWLRREKKIVFTNNSDDKDLLIKIAEHSADNVTEIDVGLYKLMKQENELIKEIQLMEEEKINVINETKSYLAKGLRQVAKTHLRKKVEFEKTIEKRAKTLDNIRALISSIQDTHTNTAVLSAYKTGSDVLKKLNESGLSESNVRDIMDDFSEAIEEQKEVQQILSETLKSDESDIGLEQELEELLKVDEDVFPETPSTNLCSTVEKLEESFKNFHIGATTIIKTSPNSPEKSKPNYGKKKLAETECV